MKILIFAILLLSLSNSYAAQDSVAVFYKPEKVIVLLNEKMGVRLNGFMDAVGAKKTFTYVSIDEALRINCGRNALESTCTFRLLSGSDMGEIKVRNVEAFVPASQLPAHSDYEMIFESSMGDKFHLKITSEGLWYSGSKKNL